MNKLVSVIIPAYNVGRYIEQCIKSVINQSYKQLEIIIVNDGSQDDTLEKVKKLKSLDKRIYIINQVNKGLPAARNSGLRYCTGKFIFFLDSDDWIEKHCIEKLIGIQEETNADIVFFDYYKNYASHEIEHHVYNKNFLWCKERENEFLLWDMRTITAWGKLYSRGCVRDILFDENMRTAEDVDFNYRVYKNVKVAYFTNECLLHYRILEHSAIHGYDSNIASKFQYPLKKIASYMKMGNDENVKSYYSFVAIAYIIICQNGIVRNNKLSIFEKRKKIKEISEQNWAIDLFQNTKYVSIPTSRKMIIYCSKYGIYSTMLLAAIIRRRIEK